MNSVPCVRRVKGDLQPRQIYHQPEHGIEALSPKDDLEHLLAIDFERGCNLRRLPPARSGIPMANGLSRVVLVTRASSGAGGWSRA
jgi:hypothetical protein